MWFGYVNFYLNIIILEQENKIFKYKLSKNDKFRLKNYENYKQNVNLFYVLDDQTDEEDGQNAQEDSEI